MTPAAAQRLAAAEWLELSGLPLLLNQARGGAWAVYKKLIELDCAANEQPGDVQISPAELAARCGLEPAPLEKIIDTLRKKKLIRAWWPEHIEEPAVIELLVPPPTPLPPSDVTPRLAPLYRHVGALRYAQPRPPAPLDEHKVQQVAEWYLHHLSQKMNSFVLEQIEHAVRRFPLEKIHATIERAERHNLRTFGWVLKELYRNAER